MHFFAAVDRVLVRSQLPSLHITHRSMGRKSAQGSKVSFGALGRYTRHAARSAKEDDAWDVDFCCMLTARVYVSSQVSRETQEDSESHEIHQSTVPRGQ